MDKSVYEVSRDKSEIGEGMGGGGANEDDADYNLEEGIMLSENEMAEDEIDDHPTKLVEFQKKLQVQCKQRIFDYSGRYEDSVQSKFHAVESAWKARHSLTSYCCCCCRCRLFKKNSFG